MIPTPEQWARARAMCHALMTLRGDKWGWLFLPLETWPPPGHPHSPIPLLDMLGARARELSEESRFDRVACAVSLPPRVSVNPVDVFRSGYGWHN